MHGNEKHVMSWSWLYLRNFKAGVVHSAMDLVFVCWVVWWDLLFLIEWILIVELDVPNFQGRPSRSCLFINGANYDPDHREIWKILHWSFSPHFWTVRRGSQVNSCSYNKLFFEHFFLRIPTLVQFAILWTLLPKQNGELEREIGELLEMALTASLLESNDYSLDNKESAFFFC